MSAEHLLLPPAAAKGLSETAIWILDADHISVPVSYAPLLCDVVRIRDNGSDCNSAPWLEAAIRWDCRLVERYTEKNLPERVLPWDSAVQRLKSREAPVITSLDLSRSLQIHQEIGRPIYWMSIENHGATDPTAIWEAWLADQASFDVRLSIISGSEVLEQGRREFRMSRTSPVLGQYEALRGAAALIVSERDRMSGEGIPKIERPLHIAENSGLSDGGHHLTLAMRVLARIGSRRLRNRIFSYTPPQWTIGIARRSSETPFISERPTLAMKDFHWIESHSDGFIADPFLIDLPKETVLFFEELKYSDWHGRLKAVALDEYGRPRGTGRVVLEKPYHLSFPNAFRAPTDAQGMYLLPEQSASGQTVLYRSPPAARLDELEFIEHSVIVPDLAGIDPVLHWADPYWYLFVSNGAFGNLDNNLELLISSRLEGPYDRHPASPISLGLRGSRMAGQLLLHEGQLLRFGQDCVAQYGERIIVFRVDVLTPYDYHETEIRRIACDHSVRGLLGVHSLTATSSFLAIDILKKITSRS